MFPGFEVLALVYQDTSSEAARNQHLEEVHARQWERLTAFILQVRMLLF